MDDCSVPANAHQDPIEFRQNNITQPDGPRPVRVRHPPTKNSSSSEEPILKDHFARCGKWTYSYLTVSAVSRRRMLSVKRRIGAFARRGRSRQSRRDRRPSGRALPNHCHGHPHCTQACPDRPEVFPASRRYAFSRSRLFSRQAVRWQERSTYLARGSNLAAHHETQASEALTQPANHSTNTCFSWRTCPLSNKGMLAIYGATPFS